MIFKKLVLMGSSTLLRIVNSVVLFVIIARILGVNEFGVLVYYQSVSLIFILLVEFGFTNQLLKSISQNKKDVVNLISEAFMAKLLLSALFLIFNLLFCLVNNYNFENSFIFLGLSVSLLFTSYGDFFNIHHRALDNYGKETTIVFIATIVIFTSTVYTLLNYESLFYLTIALFISRLFYCLISYFYFVHGSGNLVFDFSFSKCILKMNHDKYYAFDAWIVGATRHLDVILIYYILGTSAVGIYQAGMNLCRGIERFGPVMANVFLPLLSRYVGEHDTHNFNKTARLMSTLLYMGGLLVLLVFCFLNEFIVNWLYGESFEKLVSLLPLFGFFLLLRFVAISKGVVLTSRGLQKNKTLNGVLAFITLIFSIYFFTYFYGIKGVILAHITAALLLIFLFSRTNKQSKKDAL